MDPIRHSGGDINFFAYIANNPIVHLDSSGLKVKLTAKTVYKSDEKHTLQKTPGFAAWGIKWAIDYDVDAICKSGVIIQFITTADSVQNINGKDRTIKLRNYTGKFISIKNMDYVEAWQVDEKGNIKEREDDISSFVTRKDYPGLNNYPAPGNTVNDTFAGIGSDESSGGSYSIKGEAYFIILDKKKIEQFILALHLGKGRAGGAGSLLSFDFKKYPSDKDEIMKAWWNKYYNEEEVSDAVHREMNVQWKTTSIDPKTKKRNYETTTEFITEQ